MKHIKTPILFLAIFSILLPSCLTSYKNKKQLPEKVVKKKSPRYLKGINAETFKDRTSIEIETEGNINYTAFKLTEPLRLVIDLKDMKVSSKAAPMDVNGSIVTDIRSKHFTSTNITRVEIGLKKIVPHEILRKGDNKLVINLTNTSPDPETAQQQKISKSMNENRGEKIKIAAAVQEPDITNEISTKQSSSSEDKVKNHEEEAGKGPLLFPETVAIKPLEYDTKKYTGDHISLDFQDAEVSNILRFIAEISGANIITSEQVRGKVNLKLINVPWDQALDIVLKTKELGMERENNIIRILPLSQLEKEKQSRIKAENAKMAAVKAKEKAEDLFTEVVPINYATAKDLIKNVQKLKSERGEIDVNTRTNTLIIKDIKRKLEQMKTLIRKLDRRTALVSIEARIVEVNRTFTKALGVQWGGLYSKSTNYAFPDNIGLRGGIAPTTSKGNLSLVNTLPNGGNFVTHMPAAVGSGSGAAIGLSLGHMLGSAALDITLSAMESSGNGKILSNPRITTEDNKEATIKSGRSIPYQVQTDRGFSIQFADAVISLIVTPHITRDQYISMKIVATKNDADFSKTVKDTPSIIKKNAETHVLVRDGDTTVIGGLYTSTRSKSITGVPWFSNIPLLGWLFTKKSWDDSSTELLIFITPKILTI